MTSLHTWEKNSLPREACVVLSPSLLVLICLLQVLNSKAVDVRDSLLEALVVKAREQNNDIISRYNAILARIAEKPTNEADLAGLRGFIADSKEKV